MKHLVALIALLTIATAANASLLSDNFNDGSISDWTVRAGTGWVASGTAAQKLASDDTLSTISKSFAGVSSGVLTLTYDVIIDGIYRPFNAALTDSTGKGVFLAGYAGNGYVEIGGGTTSNYGYSGSNLSKIDAPGFVSGKSMPIKYELDLATGELKGYIGGGLMKTSMINLAGIGDINTVAFTAKKKINSLDNVVLIPEPASMALLGMGSLALLRRRKQ